MLETLWLSAAYYLNNATEELQNEECMEGPCLRFNYFLRALWGVTLLHQRVSPASKMKWYCIWLFHFGSWKYQRNKTNLNEVLLLSIRAFCPKFNQDHSFTSLVLWQDPSSSSIRFNRCDWLVLWVIFPPRCWSEWPPWQEQNRIWKFFNEASSARQANRSEHADPRRLGSCLCGRASAASCASSVSAERREMCTAQI